MKLELCTAPRIIYERGKFDSIGALAAEFGQRALVVRGGDFLERSGAIARLEQSFQDHGVSAQLVPVSGEPTTARVDEIAGQVGQRGCDVVIGLGGGASIDAAKAVAGLVAHGGEALDYLEVVGRGQPIPGPAVPFIAVPTTAGTGSEVTKNAVLTCEAQKFKASMRSLHLMARVALIDPSLTHSAPPEVTASTGLDALTQLIEPYTCARPNPITDALALTGIRLVAGSLRRAYLDGEDAEARDDMALAALLSGICLANSGLGAVHGFAAPLGAAFPVPHGVACAALLPHVMRANVAALRDGDPNGAGVRRYAEAGEALLGRREGSDAAIIDATVEAVAELTRDLGIPGLAKYGLGEDAVPDLVDQAKRASSMRANPVKLSDEALADCLQRSL